MALKVLQAPGTNVSPEITIQTLLSNNLISEAFEYQRTQNTDELLLYFFNFAFKIDKSNLLLDLALNERENEIFNEFLKKSDDYSSTNLQLTYLLQRSKFFDILKLINDGAISNEYTSNSFRDILLLYHSTLGPTTKYLTSLTSSNREKFQLKEDDNNPEPLSKGLISNSLDMKNAIFEKTIMNIKGVANNFYMRTENNEINNIPFLRKQVFHIPKPQVAYEEGSVKSETIRASLNHPNKRSRDSMSTYDDDRSSNTHVSIINLDEIAASQPPAKKKRFCNSNASTSIRESEPYKNISTRVIKTIKNKKMFSKSMPYSRNDSRLSRTPERSFLPSAKSLLHTPIISKVYGNPSDLGSFTPHSILKSDRSSCCSTPSNIDMEVKSLKFTSPLSETLNSTNRSYQECENFSFVENEKDDNLFDKFLASDTANPKESTNDAVQSNSLAVFNGPTPRKSLRSRSKTPIEEDVVREEYLFMETDSAENKNKVEIVIQDTCNMETDSNENENTVQVVIQDSICLGNQLSDMAPTTSATTNPSNVYDLRSRTKTPEKILPFKNTDENIVAAIPSPALPEIPIKKPLNRLLLEANVKKYFDEFKKQNEDTNSSIVVPSEMMKKINETLSANDTIESDVSIINNYTSILDDTGFNETFMRKFEEKHQISSTNASVLDESVDMIQKTHYLNSSIDATEEDDVNEKEESERDKSQNEPKDPTTESVILIDSVSESSDAKSDKEDEEEIISESDDEVVVDAEKDVSQTSSGSYGDNIDLADEDDEELEDEYDEEDESVVDVNDNQENEVLNDVNTSGDDSRDASSYSDSNSKDSNAKDSTDEGSVIAISSSDESENEDEPLAETKKPVQIDQPEERETTERVEPPNKATIPEVLTLSQTVDNSDLLYGFDNDEDDIEVEVEQNEELECAQIYDDDFEITVNTRSDEIIDGEESTTVEVNTICVTEQTTLHKTLDQGFVETVNQQKNIDFQNSGAEETIETVDAMDVGEDQPNISNITSDTSTVFQSFTEDNHDDGFVLTELTVPVDDNFNPQEHTVAENVTAGENLNLQIETVEEKQEPSLYIFKDLPASNEIVDSPDHNSNPVVVGSENISVTSRVNTEFIASGGEIMPAVFTKEAVDATTSDVSLRMFKDLPIAENVDVAENSSNTENVRDIEFIDNTPEVTSSATSTVLIIEEKPENSLFLFKDLPETSQANASIAQDLSQNSKSVTVDGSKLDSDEKKIKLFQNVPRPESETNTEINSDSSDSRKLEIDMDEESRENEEIEIEKTEDDFPKRKIEYRDQNIAVEALTGGGDSSNHDDTLAEKKIYMLRSTSMTNVASPIDRVFTRGASAPRSEQLSADDLALRTPKRKTRRNSTTSEPGTPLTPLRRSSRHLSTNSLNGENPETEVHIVKEIEVSDESKSAKASKSNIKTSKNDLRETESHTIAGTSFLEQGKRIRTRSISKSEDHSDAESDISVISTASTTKRLRSTSKKQNVTKNNSSDHEVRLFNLIPLPASSDYSSSFNYFY